MFLVPYVVAGSFTDAVATALPSIGLLVLVVIAALVLRGGDDDLR